MRRKIIAIFIAVFVLLFFVACGDDVQEGSDASSQESTDDGIDRIGVEGTEFEAENTHWITGTSPFTGREVECIVYDKRDDVEDDSREPFDMFCFEINQTTGTDSTESTIVTG